MDEGSSEGGPHLVAAAEGHKHESEKSFQVLFMHGQLGEPSAGCWLTTGSQTAHCLTHSWSSLNPMGSPLLTLSHQKGLVGSPSSSAAGITQAQQD